MIIDHAPKKPEIVILDSSRIFNDMRIKTRLLDNLEITDKEIVEMILPGLMYKDNAIEILEYNCMKFTSDQLGPITSGLIPKELASIYINDVDIMTKGIYLLGLAILEQIKLLNLYTNGYLFYVVDNLLGRDIVLKKLLPSEIS